MRIYINNHKTFTFIWKDEKVILSLELKIEITDMKNKRQIGNVKAETKRYIFVLGSVVAVCSYSTGCTSCRLKLPARKKIMQESNSKKGGEFLYAMKHSLPPTFPQKRKEAAKVQN